MKTDFARLMATVQSEKDLAEAFEKLLYAETNKLRRDLEATAKDTEEYRRRCENQEDTISQLRNELEASANEIEQISSERDGWQEDCQIIGDVAEAAERAEKRCIEEQKEKLHWMSVAEKAQAELIEVREKAERWRFALREVRDPLPDCPACRPETAKDDDHDCRWRKALREMIAALGYGDVVGSHKKLIQERDAAREELDTLKAAIRKLLT
jgi:hypothetical protein